MGYELHLVKKGWWFDIENQFTENEWQNLRGKHPVPGWLYFLSGDISAKNPNESQIITLVKIAKNNGWPVQGDDGETYSEDGSPIHDVAADVSRLKYPRDENERTHVRCYELFDAAPRLSATWRFRVSLVKLTRPAGTDNANYQHHGSQ
jgi:hypothetical protein